MRMPRLHFGRRRRNPASAALVIVFCLGYVGYDHLCQEWQKRQAWSGSVTRVYQEKGFLGGSKAPSHGYWEVRTTDGEERSVRIWTRSLWNEALPGDVVVKREGELHPLVISNR